MTSHLANLGLTRRASLFHQDRDSFLRDQAAALSKAINQSETPVKEKHVRVIIIGTFEEKGGLTFWSLISKTHLQDHPIVTWKFCHVLHKVLRDGHRNFIQDSQRYKGLLLELGKLWGHLKEGYGRSIQCYCNLLERKLDFHMKNPLFPGNLNVTDENLIKIADNDVNNYFEMSAEMFDYMDEILNLQISIFDSLDSSRANSMTVAGQCKISPLIPCIIDSSHLYDYIVKMLFKLHASIPSDHLIGHRERFSKEFPLLRRFYQNSHNLQYFKNLISVPSLPEHPPNFLVASELNQHVTPVVILPEEVEDEPAEGLLIDTVDSDTASPQTNGTSQALLEKDKIIEQLRLQVDSIRSELHRLQQENQTLKDSIILERNEFEQRLFQQQIDMEKMEEEKEKLQHDLSIKSNLIESAEELEKKAKSVEEKYCKLKEVYQKLRTEHIQLLRNKAEGDKVIQNNNSKLKELEDNCTDLQNKIKTLQEEKHQGNESLTRAAIENQAALNVLKIKLQEVNDERDKLQQELDIKGKQNNEAIEDLKKQFLAMENVHIEDKILQEQLAKDLDTAKAEMENYKSIVEKLEKQEDILNSKTIALESTVSQLKDDKMCVEKSLDDMKMFLKKLLDQVLSEEIGMVTSYAGLNDGLGPSPTSPEYLLSLSQRALSSLEALESCHSTYVRGDLEYLAGVVSGVCNTSQLLAQLATQGKAIALTVPDIDKGDVLSERCGDVVKSMTTTLQCMESANEAPLNLLDIQEKVKLVTQQTEVILGVLKTESKDNLVSSLEEELADMEKAIEAAVLRMEGMSQTCKERDTGIKLEVNGMILESCTALVSAIKILVKKSRLLQEEIVLQGKGTSSAKEFYKRNHRWTEGLISAAKIVGCGAKYLVDSADKVVSGKGKFEELIVSSQEVAGGTAQLVVASRVKADRSSTNLQEVTRASRGVSEATANVLTTARNCMKLIEEKSDEVDMSKVSLHQAKRLEMESQVKVLELESALVKERAKLAGLRRAHYQLAGESEGWTKEDYQDK